MKSTRWQDNFLNHFAFLFFVFTLLNTLNAFAGPTRTTYQAKIVKPDGYPLEAASVNFKFTILDPSGSCILFAETYNSVNMSSTGGLISFSLGAGVKTFPVSGTTFEQIFSNITPNMACDTGGAPAVYTPMANDARKIVMQFHDGGGWQTLPAMNINAVPYAMYANDSQKFNGMAPSEFVQVSTIPTCTASEALRYTGSAFQCVAAGGSGPVSSGSVITALGYTPADSATVSTVSTYASNVSSTVFSISSTVSSFQSSVAASFSAIVNSQWITSGTAIGYDAGRVGIGTLNPAYNLHVMQPVSGPTSVMIDAFSGTPGIYFRKANGTAAAPQAVSNATALLEIAAVGHGQTAYLASSAAKMIMAAEEDWTDATGAASIRFHTRGSSTTTASSERMRIDKNGNVGIGTVTPMTKLDVSGGVRISMEVAACAVSFAGTLRYNSGVVEYCNGSAWTQFGVSGAGITALNGLVSGSQTFALGNSGTLPNISSTGSVHTFNFPYAASAGVTSGLISNTDYATFNNKQSATSAAMIVTLGYTPANAVSVTTLSSTLATMQASVATITSSQWVTSGSAIYYNAGNVGIGTSSPASRLDLSANAVVDANTLTFSNLTQSTNVILRTKDYMNNLGWQIAAAGGSQELFHIRDGAGNPRLFINTANNTMGVGAASATARLHITSGTAAIPAFKFTSGTLVTTPQSGSMEFDGFNFYLTDTSGIRRAIATGASSSSIDNASIINSSGNITMVPQTGSVIVSSTTASINSATGALIVNGGVGIAGDANIAGTLTAGHAIMGLSTGMVGIGASTPTTKLDVRSEGAIKVARIQYSGSGFSTQPNLEMFRSRGTIDSPTAVLANDVLGSWSAIGHNGVSFGAGSTAGILIRATQNFSGTSAGSYMTFNTTASGTSTQVERMRIDNLGNMGLGTTAPDARLDVVGAIKITGFSSGTFMYVNDNASSGTPLNDGARFVYDGNAFGGNYDAIVFEKTDANNVVPDGGFLFANRGSDNIRQPAMAIRGTGNVGIGTIAPVAGLHISTTGTSTRALRIVATTSATGGYAEAQFASDAREYRIGVGNSTEVAHNVAGKYYLYDGASNTMRLVVDQNGNIGAGTAAPITRLDISRPTTSGSQMSLRNNGNGGFLTVPSSSDGVILTTAKYDGGMWITSSPQASAFTVGEGTIQMFTNTGLTPGASFSYAERVRVDNQGNFLIGTTNSTHGRLAVESSGTAYLSLNTTNGTHKRSGVYFRSGGVPQMEIGVDAGVNGARDFYIYDSVSGASRLHVNANGYVGIGTGAPKLPLDVMGIIGTTWGTAFNTSFNGSWNQTTTGYAGLLQFEPSTGKFYFWNTPATAAAGAANPFPVQSMTIDKDGKVGIGTASPGAKFHVNGDARINSIMGGENNGSGNFHLDAWGSGADRSVYLNWASGTGGAKVGNGSSTWGPIAASAFNVSSDRRLKDNIKPIENPLEKILKIDAVTFTWKEASRHKMEGERIGLIAQNVEKIFPQAVKLDHSENALPGGTRLVNYPDLVSPIIAAIKEFYSLWVNDSKDLHREIASVKQENETLKLQNIEKEKQLNDIRAYLCAKDPQAPICQ